MVLDYTVTLSYNVPCTNEDGSTWYFIEVIEKFTGDYFN